VVLLTMLPAPAHARQFRARLGIGAEQWATGDWARGGLGLALQATLGVHTASDWFFGGGLRRWTPTPGQSTWLLWSLFAHVDRTLGNPDATLRPVLGARAGIVLYDL